MKIGIDIGGSHIGIGVVDENGKIIEKCETDLYNKCINNIELNNCQANTNSKPVLNGCNNILKQNNDITEFIETYIVENIKKLQKNYNNGKFRDK